MRVRIDVDSPELGELTITRDDGIGGYVANRARAALVELLTQAVMQTCRAYEIDPVSISSRIGADDALKRRGPISAADLLPEDDIARGEG